MLGHRGCRLGITCPEIMIPLVGHVSELCHQKRRIAAIAEQVFAENVSCSPYRVPIARLAAAQAAIASKALSN